jgi:hypothetical protein
LFFDDKKYRRSGSTAAAEIIPPMAYENIDFRCYLARASQPASGVVRSSQANVTE